MVQSRLIYFACVDECAFVGACVKSSTYDGNFDLIDLSWGHS